MTCFERVLITERVNSGRPYEFSVRLFAKGQKRNTTTKIET